MLLSFEAPHHTFHVSGSAPLEHIELAEQAASAREHSEGTGTSYELKCRSF